MNFWWTEDKVTELRAYHLRGMSGSEIAREMGVTRNTVIGKLHRIGCSGGGLSEQQKAARKKQTKERSARNNLTRAPRVRVSVAALNSNRGIPRAPLPRPVIAPYAGSLEIPFADLRDFRGTEANQCRYIAGDGHPHFACGMETLSGESYCHHHKKIVCAHSLQLSEEERGRRRQRFLKANAFHSAEARVLAAPYTGNSTGRI